jgi:4-amino-4-deoxy-L-arabinose transferase-like glycosyltransferase
MISNLDHIPVKQDAEVSPVSDRFDNAFWFQLAAVLGIFACICLLRSAMVGGFTRAESCFAEGAREMLVGGQFLAPLLDNVLYFDKPPLYYWLLIGAYKIFGVSLFCARAVAVVLGILTVATTSIFVRKYMSARAAILTAAILCTNFCFFEFASVAMPDMLLCLCDVVAIFALFSYIYSKDKIRTVWAVVVGAAISLGWLTKGPIALLIVGTAFGILLLLFNRLTIIRARDIVVALLTFCLILIPWHVCVYQAHGLAAFDWLYLKGMFGRYLGVHQYYNFGHSLTYMFTSLMSGFLPWSVFFLPALWLLGQEVKREPERKENQLLALMMIWIAVNTLFFSFSNSNWGYYSLPILPAMSLVTGYFLKRYAETQPARAQAVGLTLSIALPFAGIYFVPKAISYLGVADGSYDLAGKAIVILVGLTLGYFFARKQLYAGFCSIGMLFAIAMVAYTELFLPVKAHNDEYLHLVETAKTIAPGKQLFCHSDLAGQYLLVDYLNLRCERVIDYCDDSQVVALANCSKSSLIVMPAYKFDALPPDCKARLQVLEKSVFNYVDFPGCKLDGHQSAPRRSLIVLARVASH